MSVRAALQEKRDDPLVEEVAHLKLSGDQLIGRMACSPVAKILSYRSLP